MIYILILAALVSCDNRAPIEPNRSCILPPTWCETPEAAWFNRRTSNRRTTSICAESDSKLTYFYGEVSREPLQQLTAPMEISQVHEGITYREDTPRNRFDPSVEQSDVILVETYVSGSITETVFILKVDFDEHHLVRQEDQQEESCFIYLIIPFPNEIMRARAE